jgi:uncharacterized repeat protein (TIGR03803 family)
LVLVLATSAWAGSETVLYQFMGDQDGYTPQAGVLFMKGKIYGTTFNGGAPEWGTVFQLTRTQSGWTKKTIYAFTARKDGGLPLGELAKDEAGKLYGTAIRGGNLSYEYGTGCGVVFELTPAPQRWKETVVHAFHLKDGCMPQGELVWDGAGNLYGTTSIGGDLSCARGDGCGTVFKLSRSAAGWKLITLHAFHGKDGGSPVSLLRDRSGNFYGATAGGGDSELGGTVFKLSPSGKTWKLTTLYSFTGGNDGSSPLAGVVFDQSGALYGTTYYGGTYGLGVVYKLTPAKPAWKEKVLHTFAGGQDGGNPYSNLLFDPQGNLYGTASAYGGENHGEIFKLTNSGGQWTESIAFSFNESDGSAPEGDIIWDASGNLYGTTSAAGDFCNGDQSGCGNVYEFTP